MSINGNAVLRRGLLSASVLALGLGVAACGNSQGERALSGGAIGAGVGAAAGAVTGCSLATGAIVGGAAGAATGALTDADDIRLD